MVSFRIVAFAVFFHAITASALFIPSRPAGVAKIDARGATSTASSAIASATGGIENIDLPNSGRLGVPAAECADAVDALCEQ